MTFYISDKVIQKERVKWGRCLHSSRVGQGFERVEKNCFKLLCSVYIDYGERISICWPAE